MDNILRTNFIAPTPPAKGGKREMKTHYFSELYPFTAHIFRIFDTTRKTRKFGTV
jgi:hypothetical protein